MNTKIEQAILGAFVADAYLLGSHWIYDAKQLEELSIDWESLNAPQAMWHKGKVAGDFTHYGDHCLWLLKSLQGKEAFSAQSYAQFWQEKMKDYEGYIDGSSRETLEHLQAGKPADCGPVNHDLSICGRIAPLLQVSKNREDFVSQAVMFAKITHNDATVLEAVHFFASLLWDVIEGKSLALSIKEEAVNYSTQIQQWIDDGIASKSADSVEVIREFGPACGVDGGFAGTIHLLSKYSDFKSAMQANAKAGGDSSARGMIVGMILGALQENNDFPWIEGINNMSEIRSLIRQ